MADHKSKAQRAYLDLEFLASPDARAVRILSEYFGPLHRFREEKVKDTVVFYGSARTMQPDIAERELQRAEMRLLKNPDSVLHQMQLRRAEADFKMSHYYEDARKLAYMITEWALSLKGSWNRFLVCSGGGPGIMEAANRGAAEAGGKTIGLGISLPFEEQCNSYITDKLAMEFHYFFMRKYWFVYMSRGLCIFPGGFGTLDELMDLLTLLQTRKIRRRLPVIMYGSEYWKEVVNFEALVKWGTISPEDLDLITYSDSPEHAFEVLIEALTDSNGRATSRKHSAG
ncbi:MAG: LOG family protein [Armatimonadetes bacterium]|nr:LOG family protein [Armatimonadota bacterium]